MNIIILSLLAVTSGDLLYQNRLGNNINLHRMYKQEKPVSNPYSSIFHNVLKKRILQKPMDHGVLKRVLAQDSLQNRKLLRLNLYARRMT